MQHFVPAQQLQHGAENISAAMDCCRCSRQGLSACQVLQLRPMISYSLAHTPALSTTVASTIPPFRLRPSLLQLRQPCQSRLQRTMQVLGQTTMRRMQARMAARRTMRRRLDAMLLLHNAQVLAACVALGQGQAAACTHVTIIVFGACTSAYYMVQSQVRLHTANSGSLCLSQRVLACIGPCLQTQ